MARPNVVIFGAAVAVRLLYWALMTPHWRPMSDSAQYVGLAHSLADGHGYGSTFPQLWHHPTAFRPPLYPLLLTPMVWLSGNALWPLRLLSVVIGAAVAVLASRLAWRIGGVSAGVVAGILVAVYPPLVANDTVTLSEPLALLLLLASVLLIDSRRWQPGAITTALLLLTRPNGYLVVLIFAVWLWRLIGWRRATGYVAIVGVCVGPWLIRNEIQVHTLRFVTSDGFTMAAIYGPSALSAGAFIDPIYDPKYDSLQSRLARLDEARWDDDLMNLAVHEIRKHPSYVLSAIERNAAAYFEIRPSLNEKAEWFDGRRWLVRQIALPMFYIVTIFAMFGFVRWRRDIRVVVLGVLAVQFASLSLLLVAAPRLRAPFDLICCIGAGLGYANLQRTHRRSSRRDPNPIR